MNTQIGTKTLTLTIRIDSSEEFVRGSIINTDITIPIHGRRAGSTIVAEVPDGAVETAIAEELRAVADGIEAGER